MKKNNYKFYNFCIPLLLSMVMLLMISSCKNDVTPSINDQEFVDGPIPKINSVDPPDSALAGITIITIEGENFSPILEKNLVSFNNVSIWEDEVAQLISATETQLQVKVPLLIEDSVLIRIAVSGPNQSELFDDPYYLDLKPAVVEIFGDADNVPSGITTDLMGNLYFNLESFGLNEGMKRFTPARVIEDFAGKSGSFYIDLKYGRDGRVYGTRSPTVRAIFANEEGGGNPSAIPVSNSAAKLISLDFDNNYNIWTGGTGGDVYRITEDGSDKKPFPFEPEISSLRFYNGYIYVAAKMDSTEAIYRMEVIDADNLGAPEMYFDLTANIAPYSVNAITFANDGRMFLGTDAELDDPNVLFVVNTDGSFNNWYPGVVTGPIASFAWDTGSFLYYVRESVGATQLQKIMRINMVTEGAPYYGRD